VRRRARLAYRNGRPITTWAPGRCLPGAAGAELSAHRVECTGDTDKSVKVDARSVSSGRATEIVRGPGSTEVTLRASKKLGIVSVVTTQPAKRLNLKKSQRGLALVKADCVILGVDQSR